MKHVIPVLVTLCFPLITFCQDVTGLWKGTIYNDSTKKSLPYEIVIKKENGKLNGWSYTSFWVNEKIYYGIKKVKVRLAKDGKIVIQDDVLLQNDYPLLDGNVQQLNVLELITGTDEAILDGPFATNRTRQYCQLTGHINLKRVSNTTTSVLMEYLQKNVSENGIVAAN